MENCSAPFWVIKFQSCSLSCTYCQFSSFLQYLATALQNVSNFSPLLLIWPHWDLKLPLSWSPASWSWMTWYKLQRNHHNRSCVYNFHACYCVGHSESLLEHLMRSPRTLRLQMMLQAQHVDIFSTVCPLDSETSFIVCSNHWSLFFFFFSWEFPSLNAWLLAPEILYYQVSTNGSAGP